MARLVVTLGVALVAVLTVPATAQSSKSDRSGSAEPSAASGQDSIPQSKSVPSSDIVVEGLREEKQNIAKTLVAMPSPVGFQRVADNATMFARCVKNPKLDELRTVVDGAPNSAASKSALDWLIRTNPGCYRTYINPPPSSPYYGDCNPQVVEDSADMLVPTLRSCAALYDRGALLGAAIMRYVPDFKLTKKDIYNRAVVARLNAREFPRNRFRLPEDAAYFKAAICMVGRQPELATRLVQAFSHPKTQAQIGQLILVRAKVCVGDPARVHVEPGQFAAYITDAAYRWEVAVRGVDSLLPVAE